MNYSLWTSFKNTKMSHYQFSYRFQPWEDYWSTEKIWSQVSACSHEHRAKYRHWMAIHSWLVQKCDQVKCELRLQSSQSSVRFSLRCATRCRYFFTQIQPLISTVSLHQWSVAVKHVHGFILHNTCSEVHHHTSLLYREMFISHSLLLSLTL